jgi:V8-like Glu-specific endopeptidase
MDSKGDTSLDRALVSSEGKDHSELPTEDTVASYWTLERMQNARSRCLPGSNAPRASSSSAEAVPLTPATSQVRNITKAPYNAIGKFFFTVNGDDHAGSGSMIGTNVLLTAAHNVELNEDELPRFSENFKFCLQYANKNSAQDLYGGSVIFPRAWLTSQASRHDWALLKTTTALNNVTPLALFSNRVPNGRPAMDVGYPDAGGYDGQTMWESSSDVTFDPARGVYIMESDLQTGTSGGPLIAADDDGHDKVFSVHCERTGLNIDGPELDGRFADALAQSSQLVNPWGKVNLPDSGFNHVALLRPQSMPNYGIAACNGGLYGFDLQTGVLTSAKRIDLGYGSDDMRMTSDGADDVYVGINGRVVCIGAGDFIDNIASSSKPSVPGFKWDVTCDTKSDITNVLYANGKIYAGYRGKAYQISKSGDLEHVVDLSSSEGTGETRLAASSTSLLAGHDGWIFEVLFSQFVAPCNQGVLPDAKGKVVDLVYDPVTRLMFAASNGKVCKVRLSPNSMQVEATADLTASGKQETRLALSDSQIAVGLNGYVYSLTTGTNFQTPLWGPIDLEGSGYHETDVVFLTGSIGAGCNGRFYQLIRDTGAMIQRNELKGYRTAEVHFTSDRLNCWIGTNGYLAALPIFALV